MLTATTLAAMLYYGQGFLAGSICVSVFSASFYTRLSGTPARIREGKIGPLFASFLGGCVVSILMIHWVETYIPAYSQETKYMPVIAVVGLYFVWPTLRYIKAE
jgi:fructose-specific phosphotransferase system IIC component